MSVKFVTPGFAVSGQLDAPAIAEAANAFKVIINNRPDGEAAGQPPGAHLEGAATATGIAYHHLPVAGGTFDAATLAAFGHALGSTDGPVLAFCRTGARSITLWALSSAPALGAERVLKAASDAGYDLASLRERIEAAARS